MNTQISKELVVTSKDDRKIVKISDEQFSDAENIANGAYLPIKGFLGNQDYLSVLETGRLADGDPFTIPIVLDVAEDSLRGFGEGDEILLADSTGGKARIEIEEIFEFDKKSHAKQVFQTVDPFHPGVASTIAMNDKLVSGNVSLLRPSDSPFRRYCLTPAETKVLFRHKGWHTIVGFQTRNVPHLGHEYVQKTALTFVDGIFLNPVIGPKKSGDFRDEIILEAYDALMRSYYLKERAVLAVLNTRMRYAGPREAVFHALIRRNFGCTHFVVGRDHAGVGQFYPPYAAQEIFRAYPDLGITTLFFTAFFYCDRCGSVANEKTCPHPEKDKFDFSGTKLRRILMSGKTPPKELIRPEVYDVIKKYPNPFVQ